MGIPRGARKSAGAAWNVANCRARLSMPAQREYPASAASESRSLGLSPAYPGVLLRVLAVDGYGLWMLLGAALALGVYRDGRSETLVPLALGAIFVSAGLLVTCLRLPLADHWHGWQPAQRSWPTAEALLALSTYLPMLAVAGLVRGNNDFWATRLAGAALLACSLASLAYAMHGYRSRVANGGQRFLVQLPASQVVAAWYSGGLWLRLCMATQDSGAHPAGSRPWIMALLLLALLLGSIEGLRWQSLYGTDAPVADNRARSCRSARFLGAIFTYAVPSVVLLLVDLLDAGPSLLAIAALSCLLGRTIEQRTYETMLLDACAET